MRLRPDASAPADAADPRPVAVLLLVVAAACLLGAAWLARLPRADRVSSAARPRSSPTASATQPSATTHRPPAATSVPVPSPASSGSASAAGSTSSAPPLDSAVGSSVGSAVALGSSVDSASVTTGAPRGASVPVTGLPVGVLGCPGLLPAHLQVEQERHLEGLALAVGSAA